MEERAVVKKILRFICVICTAVFVAGAIACFSASRIIYDADIIPNMTDEEYITYMHSRIEDALAENEEYYGFDISYLTEQIDDAVIERISADYYAQLYEYIFGQRKKLAPIVYPRDGFMKGVLNFAETLNPEEEQFDAAAAEEIADDAASVAEGCFPVAPEQYLASAKSILSSQKLKLVNFYYFLIIGAAVFFILCVVIPGSKPLCKLTLASASVFVPSFGIAAFMYMAYRYDFGSKIVIVDSPLRLLLLKYIDKTYSTGLTVSGIVAAVFGAMMLALLIVRAVCIAKGKGEIAD